MSNSQAGVPFRLSSSSSNPGNPFHFSRARRQEGARQDSPFSRFPNTSVSAGPPSLPSGQPTGYSGYRASEQSNAYVQNDLKPGVQHSASPNNTTWTAHDDPNGDVSNHARANNMTEDKGHYVSNLHQGSGPVGSQASYFGDLERYSTISNDMHTSNTRVSTSRSRQIQGSFSESGTLPVEQDMAQTVVKMEEPEGVDDFSSVMIKYAADRRNAKQALEEQKRTTETLRSELAASLNEKNVLRQKVAKVLQMSKDGSKRLEEYSATMAALKKQSEDSLQVIKKARLELSSVAELKSLAKESVHQMESYFMEDGTFLPAQDWKTTLSELQLDCCNKQQVIDLFRDKLENAQSELAESKNRTSDLERQLEDANSSLKNSSELVNSSGAHLNDAHTALRQQQVEFSDTLRKLASCEAQRESLESEAASLRGTLSDLRDQMNVMKGDQDELLKLRCLLADRESQLNAARDWALSLQNKSIKDDDSIKEVNNMLRASQSQLNDKSTALEEACKCLDVYEKKIAIADDRILSLEDKLASTELQVTEKIHHCSTMETQQEELLKQVNELKEAASRLGDDFNATKNKLRQNESQYEALQERFDQQSVILSAERDTHGNTQDTVLELKATYEQAIQVAEVKRNEEVQQFQALLDAREGQLEQLKAQVEVGARMLETKEQNWSITLAENLASITRLEKDLSSERSVTQQVEQQVHQLEEACHSLRDQLAIAKAPSETKVVELIEAKRCIEDLMATNKIHVQRASTVVSRYEHGDLTTEERQLIDIVQRSVQSVHEQQLVAKENEIRQRDYAIKTLEKRKTDLESQLARQLNTQVKAKLSTGEHNVMAIGAEGLRTKVNSSAPADSVFKSAILHVASPSTSADKPLQKGKTQSRAKNPLKSEQTPSGKGVSFAALSESDDDCDDVETPKYQPPTKKRGHESADKDDIGISRPLRRSRTVNVESPKAGSINETVSPVPPKVKPRKRR